jgi:hypothetical protein
MELDVIPEGRSNKSVNRIVPANSKEELTSRLGLIRRTERPTEYYWDGKIGDVLISIHEIPEEEIHSKKELNNLTHHLHLVWYWY